MPLQVGSPAPSFQATAYLATEDRFDEVSMTQFRGRWLCLFFFPAAFSPICPSEVLGFHDALPDLDERDCALVACSTNQKYALQGWCRSDASLQRLGFPLLADATKRIAMDYGVLVANQGVALRGTFLIDPAGTLRWMGVHGLTTGRATPEILRTLDALQTGQPCPFNWTKYDLTSRLSNVAP